MDCDRVFFALTAAPFPSGFPDDLAVVRHLGRCESCRHIAEALRPATDGAPESLPQSAKLGLPAYRGLPPEDAPRSARRQRGEPSTVAAAAGSSPSAMARSGRTASLKTTTWPVPLTTQIAAFTLASRGADRGLERAAATMFVVAGLAAAMIGVGVLAL